MDKEGFKKFLMAKRDTPSTSTINGYVKAVGGFEKWLFSRWKKRLDEANESDLRGYKKLTRNPVYAYGVRAYYNYLGNRPEMVQTIDSEIIPNLRKSRSKPRPLRWSRYETILKKAEEEGVSQEKLTLLNLLWSEMKPEEILQLRKSDVDFERLLITSRTDGEKYRVTQKAWNALRQYTRDVSERTNMFTMGIRNLQKLTQKRVERTPTMIRKSCKDDLFDEGREARFAHRPDEKTILTEEKEVEEKSLVKENLFDSLIKEIRKFGQSKWIHYEIAKMNKEEELHRVLEGYLLATFPDELIAHEFRFKGYEKKDSIIDITVGDPKIPVEVKLARTHVKIRDYIGNGSEKVKEFLKSSGSRKGILVIGDKERDPERRKFIGMNDGVYTIVI